MRLSLLAEGKGSEMVCILGLPPVALTRRGWWCHPVLLSETMELWFGKPGGHRTGPVLLSLIQRGTDACTQAEGLRAGFVFLSLLAVSLVVIHKDKGHSFRTFLQKSEYELMSVGCGWWKWWKPMGLGPSPPLVWWDLHPGAWFPAEMPMDLPRLHKQAASQLGSLEVSGHSGKVGFFCRSLGKNREWGCVCSAFLVVLFVLMTSGLSGRGL